MSNNEIGFIRNQSHNISSNTSLTVFGIENTPGNRAQNFSLGFGHALGHFLGTHNMERAPLDRFIDWLLPESFKSWCHSFSPGIANLEESAESCILSSPKKLSPLNVENKQTKKHNNEHLETVDILELITPPEADRNDAFNPYRLVNQASKDIITNLGHRYHRLTLQFDGDNVCPELDMNYADTMFSYVILSTHGYQFGLSYPNIDIRSNAHRSMSNFFFEQALKCVTAHLKPNAKFILKSCSTGNVSTLPIVENLDRLAKAYSYYPGNFALTLYRFFDAQLGRSDIEVLASTGISYSFYIESIHPFKATILSDNLYNNKNPTLEDYPSLFTKNLLVTYNLRSSDLITEGYRLLSEKPNWLFLTLSSLFSDNHQEDSWQNKFSLNSNKLVAALGYDPEQEFKLHDYRALTQYCELQLKSKPWLFKQDKKGDVQEESERLRLYKKCFGIPGFSGGNR